jgi:hypothetical protein
MQSKHSEEAVQRNHRKQSLKHNTSNQPGTRQAARRKQPDKHPAAGTTKPTFGHPDAAAVQHTK